ncbi:efflux RND transporter periplasmic adaptor subunit [Kineosporia sp. A_224]|uniref:efflux RND transporter periplasmic adaptor subunit n=1 Tax=Kineosporia sp. A_224 TaxID=1962180 RepID=UPI000B4BBA22|nr:HlyD family efflux transporter periplasmic adaptor subunit [Kineosporia sp. A_224]
MKRPPTFWLNTGLAAALLAAGGGAWYTVQGSPVAQTTTTSRTSTVRTGTLTATVTGSGNLESAASSTVDFSSSGTITDVYVTAGQTVKKGQRLARIDSAAAERSLASAKASLLSAQAAYTDTADGQSASQRKRDEISVSDAAAAVTRARKTLATARSTRASDLTKQNALVAVAQAALARGTGTAAAVSAAKATRTSVLAKDDDAIDSARTALASAQDTYELQKLSAAENADSPTAADLAKARSSVADAQAAVDEAQETFDDTTLVAPHAGTVLSIASDVGDTVGSSSSSAGSSGSASSAGATSTGSSATTSTGSSGFIELADLTDLQVTASVAEADAADVEKGQAATVTLSATDTEVAGTVTNVSVSGTTSSNVVTYPVTVTLDEVPDGVRLGASVSVSITTGSAEDAIVVPASAVTTTGNRSTVTVLDNGTEKRVAVEVGIEGDSGVQITSGLTVGQTVVLTSSASSISSNGFPGAGGPGLGSVGGVGGAPGGRP